MSEKFYCANREERWVIEFFANAISRRLATGGITDFYRLPLLRLLYGLQKFPRVTPGLTLTLYWLEREPDPSPYADDMECTYVIQINDEDLSFMYGGTRLQYFRDSSLLINMYSHLIRDERRLFLKDWIPWFQGLAEAHQPLMFADDSKGEEVDKPPLSALWDDSELTVFENLDDETDDARR